MHDEFDSIFVLMLCFFVETIIVLVILIRLDQRRDRTAPPDDRNGTDRSSRARLQRRSSHRKANRSANCAPRPATPRQPGAAG
jgi:hypothetical protein